MATEWMIGTVIANPDDEEYNPYVLTLEGWREIGEDATYEVDEIQAVEYLDEPGWRVMFRGRLSPATRLEKENTDGL